VGDYQYTIIKDSKDNIIAQGNKGWASIPITGQNITINIHPTLTKKEKKS
jgi:hypothetical protein